MAKQSFVTGQVLTAAQLTSLQQTAMSGGAASAKTANYVLVAADAGTAISMTSTSATTITVNTGLFAAGDTVFIQNLGSGVSTITAGTATVDTSASLALAQYEGGTLYFTSASASLFFKADGAAPSSGALTLISSTTYSSSSAHSVNDVFSATYDNYLILINTDSASTGADMNMRLRVSGSDNSSSNYYWANIGNNASVSAYDGTNSGGTATSWRINYNDDTNGSTQTINIRNPYLSLVTSYNNHYLAIEDNNAYPSTGGGRTTVTTSYTGFTIFPNSGNFTGKVRVYGYANS
jgi:hypothetical protein